MKARSSLHHVGAALLPAAAFYPLLKPGAVPYFCDPVIQSYPYFTYLAEQLAKGLFPLFNPYQMGGVSFVGNVQAAIFYPPKLLLALLLGSPVFGALLLLHLCFASLGTSFLAERLGTDRFGCLVAAASFSLGGFMAGKAALPPILMSAAFLPWLLLGALRAMERRPLTLALALFFSALSGHPQTILISCVFAVSAAALAALPFRPAPVAGEWRSFRLLRLVCLIVVLVYMSGFFTLASFGEPIWSPLRGTLWFLLPAIISLVLWRKGKLRLERRPSLVKPGTISRTFLYVFPAGIAALALLLPVFSLLSEARPPRTVHRIEGFTSIEDRAALAVDTPLYRRPEAEASLAVGPFPLLLALLALFQGRLPRRAGATALAGLACYLLAAGPLPVRFLLFRLPGFRLFPALPRYLAGTALAIALLAGIGMTTVRLRLKAKLLLLAVSIVPLVFLAHPFATARSAGEIYQHDAAAGRVPKGARYLSIDSRPAHYGLAFDRAAVSNLMMSNLGMVFEREDMQGYDPIHPLAYARLAAATGPADFLRDRYHLAVLDTKHPAILRLAGIRYLLVKRGAAPPKGSRFAADLEAGALYEVDHPLPRAFLADGTRFVPDPTKALRLLAEEHVPLKEALLQEEVPGLMSAQAVPVTLSRPRPGHLDVRGKMEGLLIVTELYSRGWQVQVDGRRSRPIPVDGAFMAVPCRTLTRRVELAFLPFCVRLGFFLALAVLCLATILRCGGILVNASRRVHGQSRGSSPHL